MKKIIKNKFNYKKWYFYICITIIISIITIIIIGQLKEFEYNKFANFLRDNFEAYDNMSEEELKKEYTIWMDNKGYSDIIINSDGNFEIVGDDISIYDAIPYCEEMSNGIYVYYNYNCSYVLTIDNFDNVIGEGNISISACEKSEDGKILINQISEKFYKTKNFDENNGYYTIDNYYVFFRFNKEMQQIEVSDATINISEAQQIMQKLYKDYKIDFNGNYNIIFPFV